MAANVKALQACSRAQASAVKAHARLMGLGLNASDAWAVLATHAVPGGVIDHIRKPNSHNAKEAELARTVRLIEALEA